MVRIPVRVIISSNQPSSQISSTGRPRIVVAIWATRLRVNFIVVVVVVVVIIIIFHVIYRQDAANRVTR